MPIEVEHELRCIEVRHGDERRRPIEAGAFIFVAAGREHRFVEFSADFAVWVIFYAPTGGEMEPG